MRSGGLSLDAGGGRGLPPSVSQDPLLGELIRTGPVQRLKRIGFLGAVDRTKSRNWYNRYEHSVEVAQLALLYARNRKLSRHDTRVLAVAGLLHDVGHGPLSHTLEPVFKQRFGISHHKAGREIIRGESPLGHEIPDVLSRRGLDAEEIEAMIDGTHPGPHAFLFSGPINLDTIEGITRCQSFFFGERSEAMSAPALVRAMSETNTLPTPQLDSFWRLKHRMYRTAIYDRVGLLYDGLAQAVVTEDIDCYAPHDFFKDERQLRRSRPRLFKLLDRARRSPCTLRGTLPDSILNHEIDAPTRSFTCDESVELNTVADLPNRYGQTKTIRRVRIDKLLPREGARKELSICGRV